MRKVLSTLKILYTLGMARTFGVYVHSGWNGEHDYVRYLRNGEVWDMPTSPNDLED